MVPLTAHCSEQDRTILDRETIVARDDSQAGVACDRQTHGKGKTEEISWLPPERLRGVDAKVGGRGAGPFMYDMAGAVMGSHGLIATE